MKWYISNRRSKKLLTHLTLRYKANPPTIIYIFSGMLQCAWVMRVLRGLYPSIGMIYGYHAYNILLVEP